MNVLLISSHGQRGWGGQESLLALVEGLNSEEFTPHVVVPSGKGGMLESMEEKAVFVNVIEFPKVLDFHISNKAKALWNLCKLVKKKDIWIIHTDGPRNTFYASIVARLRKIPLVWHVRTSNTDRYDPLLYRMASRIVVVAEAVKKRFNKIDNGRKITTIYNAVDTGLFKKKKKSDFIRRKYDIGDTDFLITVIARIERPKGQIDMVKACGKLKCRIKNFKVLFVGDVVDYAYLQECLEKAKELEIIDRLIFVGYVSRIDRVLNESDLFVLPSLTEAFPRSVIEAMAVGLPVIVTDVGGCSEAIEENISGFIVPPGDSDKLAEKIMLLKQDSNLREDFGRAAQKRVKERFCIQEHVKKIQQLYRELTQANPYRRFASQTGKK